MDFKYEYNKTIVDKLEEYHQKKKITILVGLLLCFTYKVTFIK